MALGTYDCKPTLTDRQMMDFCRNGYLMLEGVVSDEVNRRTIEFMKDHDVEEPVEILEEEWFVDAVIKNPQGAGAVRCLLGRDFLLPAVMSSHRIQCPGPPQPWHPDAGSVSAPRLDYLQVFYYPSGATREMGPTELIPGSHLSQARNAFLGRLRSLKPAVSTASPPGSIVITAYSIVHRRSPSTATGVRDNLKYNYWRTTPPQRDWVVDPDFNFSWTKNVLPPFSVSAARMFAWLCGEDWEHMGGQAWPCFTAGVYDFDQIGLPKGLRRDREG